MAQRSVGWRDPSSLGYWCRLRWPAQARGPWQALAMRRVTVAYPLSTLAATTAASPSTTGGTATQTTTARQATVTGISERYDAHQRHQATRSRRAEGYLTK